MEHLGIRYSYCRAWALWDWNEKRAEDELSSGAWYGRTVFSIIYSRNLTQIRSRKVGEDKRATQLSKLLSPPKVLGLDLKQWRWDKRWLMKWPDGLRSSPYEGWWWWWESCLGSSFAESVRISTIRIARMGNLNALNCIGDGFERKYT